MKQAQRYSEDEIRNNQVSYERRDCQLNYLLQGNTKITLPNYKINLIWNEQTQSRFIEYNLLGIPINPIFINTELRIVTTSDIQKIGTFNKFVNNDLVLRNLSLLKSLEGYCFRDLIPVRQRKILAINLKFIFLTNKCPIIG